MDLNTIAFRVVSKAVDPPSVRTKKATSAGSVGGRARAKALAPERRKEIAEAANKARWKR